MTHYAPTSLCQVEDKPVATIPMLKLENLKLRHGLVALSQLKMNLMLLKNWLTLSQRLTELKEMPIVIMLSS